MKAVFFDRSRGSFVMRMRHAGPEQPIALGAVMCRVSQTFVQPEGKPAPRRQNAGRYKHQGEDGSRIRQ